MNAFGLAQRQAAPLSPVPADDMDALHVLPLHILPLKHEGLAKQKLIKNAHLQGVIEAFVSKESGSGQIPITAVPEQFGIKNAYADPDFNMLLKLAGLPSYDVYSLRRSLRSLNVKIADGSALKLSDDMNKMLSSYMTQFTKPLLASVYGDSGNAVTRFEDLVGLFRDPDIKQALAKLKQMSSKLGITLDQIPVFIEDYGDIFLSLSYYQHCLDRIAPIINDFQRAVNELKAGHSMKTKPTLLMEASKIQKQLNGLLTFVSRTFEDFNARSQDMWSNLSAQKFKAVKETIENAHGTVGGVLCGLTVKMSAWHQRFPNARAGTPGGREDFLLTDIRPGLSELVEMVREQSAMVSHHQI